MHTAITVLKWLGGAAALAILVALWKGLKSGYQALQRPIKARGSRKAYRIALYKGLLSAGDEVVRALASNDFAIRHAEAAFSDDWNDMQLHAEVHMLEIAGRFVQALSALREAHDPAAAIRSKSAPFREWEKARTDLVIAIRTEQGLRS